jgi:TonB family protein
MSAPLLLDNLLAYSAQLLALVAGMLCCTHLLRRIDTRAQLRIWQVAFGVACGLPLLLGAGGTVDSVTTPFWALSTTGELSGAGGRAALDRLSWVAGLLLAGAFILLARLALGSWRLRRWCRRATPWRPGRACTDALDVRVTDDLPGPATVGAWRPIVLVPRRLLDLPTAVQDAVLQHEALHVAHRDPLQVLIAEIWHACLWFHPAAWLLTSRLELAREMTLDRETVRRTGDRRAYAEALLAFGSAPPAPGAAAFIHRRHASPRITALGQQESLMSPIRRLIAIAAVVVVSGVATTAAVIYVPMHDASRQEPLKIGEGVQPPRVLHEVKPEYTPAALQAKIQGAVWLDIVVEVDGSVGTVDVTQSLDTEYGLDDAAVDAAKQWRFEPGRKDGAAVPVQVTLEMRFTLK